MNAYQQMRADKAAKIDIKVVEKYLKEGATMRTVGKKYDVTGASIRFRLIRFIENNPKNKLAKKVKKKIAANRKIW